jgi:hypothetical protein
MEAPLRRVGADRLALQGASRALRATAALGRHPHRRRSRKHRGCRPLDRAPGGVITCRRGPLLVAGAPFLPETPPALSVGGVGGLATWPSN